MYSVNKRLTTDINMHAIDDVYLVNVYNEINKLVDQNKAPERSRRFGPYYFDGGDIVCNDHDYEAEFNFDDLQHNNNQINLYQFRFIALTDQGRLMFNDCINKIINKNLVYKREPCKADLIGKDNSIKVINERLKKMVGLHFFDASIDALTIDTIIKNFKEIEVIELVNCHILPSAYFDHFSKDVKLEFRDCTIEDTNSFYNCKAELHFTDSIIKKISHTTIASSIINVLFLDCRYRYINLEQLFLKCYFENLRELSIRASYEFGKYTFSNLDNSFMFLPYSAPNLERLEINGKVRDLNFLTKLSKLRDCMIHSQVDSSNDMGFLYPFITDKKERERLEHANESFQKRIRIIEPYLREDLIKYVAIISKTSRLGNLYQYLKERYPNEIEYLLKHQFNNFQDSKSVDEYFYHEWGRIQYKRVYRQEYFDMFDQQKETYTIKDNFMFQDNTCKNIIKARLFIYHPSGLPILFDSNSNYDPVKEALKRFKTPFVNSYPPERKDDNTFDPDNIPFESKYDLECYLDVVGLSIDEQRELINKCCPSIVRRNDLHIRYEDVMTEFKHKSKEYTKEYFKMIMDIYEKLTIDEKIYLSFTNNYSLVSNDGQARFIDDWSVKDNIKAEDKVLLAQSINKKSNGRYFIILNKLKYMYKLDQVKQKEIKSLPNPVLPQKEAKAVMLYLKSNY